MAEVGSGSGSCFEIGKLYLKNDPNIFKYIYIKPFFGPNELLIDFQISLCQIKVTIAKKDLVKECLRFFSNRRQFGEQLSK